VSQEALETSQGFVVLAHTGYFGKVTLAATRAEPNMGASGAPGVSGVRHNRPPSSHGWL
jgi:hypothetical protein